MNFSRAAGLEVVTPIPGASLRNSRVREETFSSMLSVADADSSQPQEWVRFPYNSNYAVRQNGDVMRIGGRVLAQQTAKRGGYLTVALWSNNKGKTWPVHQVVCLTFHGPRPSPYHEVAHRDGNRRNNHKDNLRWATRSENESDKLAHGTSNRGENNGRCVVRESVVLDVKRAIRDGVRVSVIARSFGLSQSHVSHIKRGRLWSHAK
jgi:hypothetical protein